MGSLSVGGICVGDRWERLQGLTLAVTGSVTVLKASETETKRSLGTHPGPPGSCAMCVLPVKSE